MTRSAFKNHARPDMNARTGFWLVGLLAACVWLSIAADADAQDAPRQPDLEKQSLALRTALHDSHST